MSGFYAQGLQRVMQGETDPDNWLLYLIDSTYVPDRQAHAFLSDIPGAKRLAVATPGVLVVSAFPSASYRVTGDEVVFTDVLAAATAVVVVDGSTGVDSTSPLIGVVTGFHAQPGSGGSVRVRLPQGLFTLREVG